MSLIGGTIFFAAFMLLEKSPLLADCFRMKLIFREVAIPVYQLLLSFGYMIFLRYVLSEPPRKAFVKGLIMGIVLNLYPLMLDTQKAVWLGATGLSAVYVLYIKIVIFLATLSLALWGAAALRMKEPSFFPVSLLAAYGAVFYWVNGRFAQSVTLTVGFALSLYGPSNNLLAVLSARLANGLQAALADKRRLLAVVFVLALVMRLVFLANLLRIEGQRYPYASDDGTSYDAYALKGSSDPAFFIRESPHKYMLFYSLPMAVIYGIFGHNYAALGIIQSVIGAFLCCLTFILADRITGSAAISLLASLGVAVDSALIHLTTTINTEALYIPFIVLTVFFLLRYREGERDRAAMAFLLAAALTLALAAFMRVVGILFAAFVGPWIIVWGRRYAPDAVLKRLRDAVLFIVTTLLVILPITCVNYINTHKICLIYVTGSDLWATGSSTWGEEMVPSNKELIELGMRDPVTDLKGSLEAFFARPAAILKAYGRIIPKRMMNLYLWPNFGLFDPIYLLNPSQRPTRYASNLEFYSLCLFFASFFVFIFSKLKTYLKSLTLLVILFYTVFHGIFFLSMSPRYGSPMRPFLYIIISFCLYKIFAAGFSVLTGKREAA